MINKQQWKIIKVSPFSYPLPQAKVAGYERLLYGEKMEMAQPLGSERCRFEPQTVLLGK